jgi:hypothetical protein
MSVDLSTIAYVVPNLPRFEVDRDQLWAWWDSVTIPIIRLREDSRGHSKGFDGEFWDGVTIWQRPEYQNNIVWKVNYCPNEELFGNITDKIINSLPWFNVLGITLWSHKTAIPPHKDGLPIDAFPSAPRINLIDECNRRSFYLLEKKKFKLFRPDLQQGPNLFFFNNQNFDHGASEVTSGRKILIRVDGPLLDPAGLREFINTEINAGAKYEGLK